MRCRAAKRVAVVALAAILGAACGGEPVTTGAATGAAPSAPPSPSAAPLLPAATKLPQPSAKTARAPSAKAAVGTPIEIPAAARSGPLLAVDGGVRAGVVFAGWPIVVRVAEPAPDERAPLTIEGPSSMVVVPAAGGWVVPAERSATMLPGAYTFRAGAAAAAVEVAPQPAAPTPAELAARHRLAVWAATLLGDPEAARAAAAAWAAAEPDSAAARAALGEALLHAGRASDALAAFGEAIALGPAASRPPASVSRGITAALLQLAPAAAAPTPAAAALAPAAAVPAPAPAEAAPAAQAPAGPPGLVPTHEHDEARFLADAQGQWAVAATAGSSYSPTYGPERMLGAPDVVAAGDSYNAWCHGSTAKGREWVELTFAEPVHATGVRVRQNYSPGAIVKVEAVDTEGTTHLWWEGVDSVRPSVASTMQWFVLRVAATDYRVQRIRLTLDLDALPGWKEIDAVQLVGGR